LELKDERCIALADELEVIKAYSFLLKTRFGDNLDIEISVGAQELTYKVAPLTIQLLMENAIKHNIISAEKHLKIAVFTANNSLVITNNLQRKKQPVESTSLGLNNIRNRYQLLTDAPVQIVETETDFTVTIPLIKE
jgi:LytS/YehU family sensor histidine kinase